MLYFGFSVGLIMRKPKIYLETTLFNFYFDSDRDAHADTVRLFQDVAAGKYEAFTSGAVTEELAKAPEPKKDRMLALLKEFNIQVLPVEDKAEKLADVYVAEKIIPMKYRTDGVHIAMAAVNGLDVVVSLNFQQIVKPKVKQLANAANVLKGFHSIEVVSPMEFVETEVPNPIEDEIDRIREKIYEETCKIT